MKNSKKIIIIDPKPSLQNLMKSLWKAGWDIQEIFSQQCHRETILQSDLSQIQFALSTTDIGISLADEINKKLGFSGSLSSTIFYNKIDQYEFINQHWPALTFDNTKIFSSYLELQAYLVKSNRSIMIRPDISSTNGSGVLFSGDYALIESDIRHLFTKAKHVLTHPFVRGESYFINGLVLNGMFHITDAWQCFNLLANQRNILVSVINLEHNDCIVKDALFAFNPVIKKLQLTFCPIHFEFIVTEEGIKIVKIVTRLATEPLPTLCNLAGIKSQLEWFDEILQSAFSLTHIPDVKQIYSVADYSFVVRHAGFLKKINFLKNVTELKSYHQTYYWPAAGAFLPRTICGTTYGATFLLANQNRNELLTEIQLCQQFNEMNFFAINPTFHEEKECNF